MKSNLRDLIEEHWRLGNAREWSAFGKLLHPDLRYECPQTREYIDSGAGYLDLFQTWPGDWSAKITNLICEENQAVCVIDFIVGDEKMTGISIFQVTAGLIHQVTDYWPEPYEPQTRQTKYMKRHAQ